MEYEEDVYPHPRLTRPCAAKTASFNEIASAEGLAERHIRRLVPLAFLSPKIIQASPLPGPVVAVGINLKEGDIL